MPKETQKAKIERLEKEIWDYKVLVSKLQTEIYDMQDKAEDSFINSPTYTQLLKKIELLEKKNKNLEEGIAHNEKIQKLKNEKKHNERGAGRKIKFTDAERKTMHLYRMQGKTIKEIAETYDCSVGLVHKILNQENLYGVGLLVDEAEDYIISEEVEERDKRDTGERFSLDEALKKLE